ncbi:hypothetical protein VC83_00180 [Pseudogymnoascus destructans]|uniref:Uncharacterized protein n=1 Tax=Pseudogymnoascus destructans TaxID=655981 RepID=A0A177APE4_9PEZI|nr:uncharacterized protein VC83_00180 [Pseudogymnoascus destructans]OAF63193.1 hypothetical protein VC83_00180 [Pseudogymnoascus destructans]
MCPFTQVRYKCGHRVFTVRAWCETYEKTHVRCKVYVVAYEKRSYACGPCRPAVKAPWMEALKIPILTQRRLSRVWRQQPPPRPVWKSPSSIKCPPSKWADHRRTILAPLHQHSHHRHHSPALVA